MSFTIRRSVPMPPEQAFAVVTDLERHTDHVPLTTVRMPDGPLQVGSQVVARTTLGPLVIDDVMQVTDLTPGRRLRVVKVGALLRGWADIVVTPDPEGGSRVEWTEELWLRGARGLTRAPGDLLGPVLFTRVVDGLLADAVDQRR